MDFGRGWLQIQKEGIEPLLAFFSTGLVSFSRADYSRLYTIIYDMCIQRNPYNFSQQLYDAYRTTFRDYLKMQVLPELQSKQEGRLLESLTRVWQNHLVMVKWMRAFFQYLDRHFVSQKKLPKLDTQAMRIFISEVYTPLRISIEQAISSQALAEREGEAVDQTCIREVVFMLGKLGAASEDSVKPMKSLCDEMVKSTGEYYEAKARTWIAESSCPVLAGFASCSHWFPRSLYSVARIKQEKFPITTFYWESSHFVSVLWLPPLVQLFTMNMKMGQN